MRIGSRARFDLLRISRPWAVGRGIRGSGKQAQRKVCNPAREVQSGTAPERTESGQPIRRTKERRNSYAVRSATQGSGQGSIRDETRSEDRADWYAARFAIAEPEQHQHPWNSDNRSCADTRSAGAAITPGAAHKRWDRCTISRTVHALKAGGPRRNRARENDGQRNRFARDSDSPRSGQYSGAHLCTRSHNEDSERQRQLRSGNVYDDPRVRRVHNHGVFVWRSWAERQGLPLQGPL